MNLQKIIKETITKIQAKTSNNQCKIDLIAPNCSPQSSSYFLHMNSYHAKQSLFISNNYKGSLSVTSIR